MSVKPADVRAHADSLLREEAVLLGTLESLLAKETTVLRSDDVSAIENIGGARHDCTTALARLAAEREQNCQLLSFKRGRDGFEKLLRWCDATGTLLIRWNANLASARRCRDLNDRNGAVVTVKLNHVQNLLIAMRGQSLEPMYSPQRRPAAAIAARELGVA